MILYNLLACGFDDKYDLFRTGMIMAGMPLRRWGKYHPG